MNNKQSAFYGAMITAGTAIGAGMFSLPTVSSGMWLGYSLLSLFFIWFLNYLSSLYILEANLQFKPGASFNTITKKTLGNKWNWVVNISIGFLMYILLYAYFSAFGSIITDYFNGNTFLPSSWDNGIMSIAIGAILAFSIWVSTAAVGRLTSFFLLGMVLTFILSMAGLSTKIELANLLDTNTPQSSYFPYLWAALPYFITSFGFVTVVPSLYKYYGENIQTIKKSLLWGSLLILVVYTLFILVSFGNISRLSFIEINKMGGNVAHLVGAFQDDKNHIIIYYTLNLFSNFAIITSFLGIGLSLFDFIADKFSFSNNHLGRFKSVLLTFIPPALASFFYPNGFVEAIGFAGLFCIIGFFIAPFFMIKAMRKKTTPNKFKVSGGAPLLYLFLISSIVIALCHVLGMLNYLPMW